MILHHDHLPLPSSGAAPFPDHAAPGVTRPLRTAVDEWRFTSQLRESHKLMTVAYYQPSLQECGTECVATFVKLYPSATLDELMGKEVANFHAGQ